ncbi:PTS sugar transporter subunit IIA [Klebsiella sp. B345]|uniref:PTS sugar transporter subunit IIA n=1 Tax=Klebsiella sp. B345 TaxID=2755398 RepID=UPI003DA8152E
MEIIFDRRLIALNQNISTASQAIELSGTLLTRQKICRPEYINAMLEVYEDFGPAIVIDDGLAMPHARPEKGASRTGFSLITTQHPIHFGHEEFDPVSVIIGIAGADANSHIKMIQIIASLIESDIVAFLRKQHDINTVFNFIHNKMETSLC